MTLNKMVPWGRKEVPVRRTEQFNSPALWTDFDEPWRDMERMFERFFSLSPGLLSSNMQREFNPVLDVHETEKEFQINVEVPGMSETDIDISMSRDSLTITGEKREEKEENSKGVYRLERRYGSFSRSIPLPDNCVDTEKVEASYSNGILTIKLPKAAGYKESVKKIPISSKSKSNVNGSSGNTTEVIEKGA